MLRKIILHNWQAHADSVLEFGPGVTAIVGPNDSGKSSIMRAVRWVAENRPRGNRFIRRGKKSCRVTVETEAGTVKRVRGKTDNYYEVDGEKLTAFGNDVPEQVSKAVGLEATAVGAQLEQHFLVLSSPGEIARALGEAVQIQNAEEALKRIASRIREANGMKRLKEGELEDTKLKLSKYIGLDEHALGLKQAELIAAGIEKREAEANSLVQAAKAVVDIEDRIEGQVSAAEIAAARALAEEATGKQETISKNGSLLAAIQQTAVQLLGAEERCKALRGVVSLLSVISEKARQANELRTALAAVLNLTDNRQAIVTRIAGLKKQIAETVDAELACPVCGRTAKPGTDEHKRIREHAA